MITAAWRGFSARLAARGRDWVQHRQGTDSGQIELHSRRIYILPTRAGLAYGAIVLILLLSSMNFSNNMGFALTFLLTGIGLVSMHHCHRNLTDLRVQLVDTESGFAGEHVYFHLQLRNPTTAQRWQLRIGWDKQVGERVELPADSSTTVVLAQAAAVRGPLTAPRIGVSSTFPLGLFRAWCWVHMNATVLVWPQPVAQADRPPAQDSETANGQTNEHAGDDLSGVREYRQGDSPRRIDWKALARYGDLLVREYLDGATSEAWLDWDAFDGMAPEMRLSTLARLALDAHAAGMQWGLRLPERSIPPDAGEAHLHNCLDQLALHGISPTETTP